MLIAAGGTGGHIFPALEIGRAFQRLSLQSVLPPVRVEFLGSGRPLEKQLLAAAGFARHEVPIVGLQNRGLSGLLEFMRLLPGAAWAVWRLLSAYRPHVVLGVGGYVSVLPVITARLRGIPAWIHEAELKPGLANYCLSFFAAKISSAFKEAKMPFAYKVVYTGHPVREELKEIRAKARRPERAQHVLVLGGSQGARTLDTALPALAPFLKEQGLEIWHQSRPENVAQVLKAYQASGILARVSAFIDDIVEAYDWADIIISRSGAGTVMEIGVVDKPAIFVPYPFAQGGHQKANALTLVNQGKALLVEEGEAFEARLKEALTKLIEPEFYKEMQLRFFPGRCTTAAATIAQGCYELARKRWTNT